MGVTFNNNSAVGIKRFKKIKEINSDPEFEVFNKVINALEIDWNEAILSEANPDNSGQYGPINDTSQLLELINTIQKEIYVLTAAVIALISNPKKYYYWYIGVDNPSSISNIQTNNTVVGWHEIGTSLSGFNLVTSDYPIVLYTTNKRTPYYLIIPNELNVYDDDGADGKYLFNEIQCNISGYKAYLYKDDIRIVSGIIIR